MKYPFQILVFMVLFGSYLMGQAQTPLLEWSDDYRLQPTDFKAKAPNTGQEQSIYASCGLSYQAINVQFLFSNLNPLVHNRFNSNASWIDEGNETEALLRTAKISWDIYEVSARKLRKWMHENRAKLNFTKIDAYLQQVHNEGTTLLSEYSKSRPFGRHTDHQKQLEQKVDSLLQVYEAYCKTCKKPKKVKHKK